MSDKPLTAVGGPFSISDEMRGMLALLPDGRLMVAKTYAFNPHVKGFIGRLKHMGHNHLVQHADLDVISGFYKEELIAGATQTDMQRAAKALFDRAVEARASDIHIRVNLSGRTNIYFRVHSDLEFVEEHQSKWGDSLCIAIYQAMTDTSDPTFKPMARQDARISAREKLPTNLDGIRIATTPQVDGYIMVLRLLYNDADKDTNLMRLGFSEQNVAAITYMKKRPTGVIIIGGPTGSGKSTTLQRCLSGVIIESGGRKHIITVEDPPEYPIEGAVQTPVTDMDTEEERSAEFQKAIKASMRLDPDVIMISEVRDSPTARLSIQAAMTGHQVWTTVHANNAMAIIDRLIDLRVDPNVITDPSIVAGLICQRLVKLLCQQCKLPLSQNLFMYEQFDIRRLMSVLNMENVYIQGPGCPHCRQLGITGRTVVAETIITDHQLMQFIRDGDKMGALGYVRREQGGQSMLEHAIEKINKGEIDPFTAEGVVGLLSAGQIEQDHRVSLQEIKATVVA